MICCNEIENFAHEKEYIAMLKKYFPELDMTQFWDDDELALSAEKLWIH